MRNALLIFICLIAQVIQAEEKVAGLPARKFADVLSEFAKAPEYQSTQATLRAIELDFAVKDLVLEPQVEIGLKRINEHREFVSPIYKTRTDTLGVVLSKPFSTGTTVRVAPTYENALSPARNPSENANVNWEISISQSLWQDAFGRSTRLRWARENFEKRQQLAAALKAQADATVDFETLYWDWAVALRERDLRLKNVTRGREIMKWIRGRLARAAAENSDVLQAESLLLDEELKLSAVEQTIRTAQSTMTRYIPDTKWQPDVADLSQPRDVEALPVRWSLDDLSRVEKLELVTARNAALASEKQAEESREGIRPVLELQLAYGKNAIDPSAGTALNQSFSQNNEQSTVGLILRTGLDFGLEYKKVEQARAVREAAKFRREALESEGAVAWTQLKRNVSDLLSRTERARQLFEVDVKKANAERQRYRMGRTTAFQAITFEKDAADSEISMWNLYALMRKTEAQARLFAR